MRRQSVEISQRTIIFVVLFCLGLWFVWSIWEIILQFFIAIILMTALNPAVNFLESRLKNSFKGKRVVSIVIVYLLFLGILGTFLTLVTQPLLVQTTSLVKQFPLVLEKLSGWGLDQSTLQQVSQINTLPINVFKFIGGAFSNVLSMFTTLVLAFYLLLEREKLHKYLAYLMGDTDWEKKIEMFIDHLELTLGGWVRAELLLMLIVGCLTYIGLVLLKVPFALPLAIIAGLLELIPNLGPTISAVPAAVVGLTISPFVSIGVMALYLFVQLLENNVIVPQVMSKTIGVNPLVTILVLLVGLDLAGVMGAVLAVPLVVLLKEIWLFFFLGKWKNVSN